jgi:hypothetical protein
VKVLVACEESGRVRDAFLRLGHDAISCDLLPTDSPGPHIEGDVREIDMAGFDLVIAFPPCTYLAVSGNRWYAGTPEREEGLELVRYFMDAPCERVAIENPIGVISTCIRKPDQIIQPWMFGHGETKATCLWLKNLPPLEPTHGRPDLFNQSRPPAPEEREQRIWRMPPGHNRSRDRSRTFHGIAEAMAEQWGRLK